MEKLIKSKVIKYPDSVNTDVIFPGRYTYALMEPEEMAKHAMEDLDPDFQKKVKERKIIVAGRNFGMGSSREQAVLSLVYAGIKAIIAKSFARIYFRNAINNGLLVIEHKEAADFIEDGDEVEIDTQENKIRVKGKEFTFPQLPKEVLKIVEAGGLINYVKEELRKEE